MLKAVAISFIAGLSCVTAALATGHSKPEPLRFPKGFRWCVATAAHQIEGGNVNSDWWSWEQQPGKTKDRSGAADDHWNRVEEDIALIRALGVSTYRFSIEWAKLEPTEGHWEPNAVAHYKAELAALARSNISPMVTLQHFTLPKWLRDEGGWESPRIPALFARFAAFAVNTIGPDVRDWITLNEPMVQLANGYAFGIHPPGIAGGIPATVAPMVGMLKAHAAAYHAMHDAAALAGHEIRVGMAHHLRVFDPPSQWHFFDAWVAGNLSQAFNWSFSTAAETGKLDFDVPFQAQRHEVIPGLAHTQDFIGMNYYSRDIVHAKLNGQLKLAVPKGAEVTDMGWEIYPEGFYRLLKSTAKHFPGKPIFITENGIDDSKDAKRARFLDLHLAAMARAMREGVPVEGYCHWSLLDNFEWADGFRPRFGLYEVDYATQKRTPRASARHFTEIVRSNQL